MKKILIVTIATFALNAVYCQKPIKSDEFQNDRIEKLKESLDLTDEQVKKIESLKSDFKSNKENHQRGAFREKMSEILTDDQKQKLKTLNKGKRGHQGQEHHRARHHGKRKFHKSKKHKFDKDSEAHQKLMEMRIEFDSKVSAEDKAQIKSIKSRKKAIIQKWKSEKKSDYSNNENRKADKKLFKEDMKPIVEDSKKLMDTYREDIKITFEENKEFFQKLKAEKLEGKEGRKKHKHFGKKKFKKMKAMHFLFMDIDQLEENINDISIPISFKSVSPNPTVGEANIFFEVHNETNVRIELSSISGQQNAVLVDKMYKPGQHYKNIDISDYPNGTYIISILTGKDIQTEKLVLQK